LGVQDAVKSGEQQKSFCFVRMASAPITDPDSLTQGTEVTITSSTRRITLAVAGNMTSDGVTIKALYSFLKEEWRSDAELIKFPFPMTPITDEQFELVAGWNFANDASRYLVRTGGWAVKDANGATLEEWAGVITLGSIESNDQVYFQQATGGAPADFQLTGPVNQAIKVFGDADHGNFDRRSFLRLFVREWQQTYDSADLTDIGVSVMTFQVYRFPLTTGNDLKVTVAETGVDSDANGVADVSPYSGMSITYYGSNQARTIGGANYNFRVIVDGNGASAEQIYTFVQWSLRLDGDIDAGAGSVTGKTATELMFFVGDTLTTRTGVFIDDFASGDTNRLVFTDQAGSTVTFPFVATLTLNFGANLVSDSDAVYRVFFSTLPGTGNDFGEADAVIVNDSAGSAMSGSVGGEASITRTFDYQGNTQGGRTANQDAGVVAVAIGLGTAQYVSATGTIQRSTANVVSLVSSLERNYANAA
jgi:hypothetical protein